MRLRFFPLVMMTMIAAIGAIGAIACGGATSSKPPPPPVTDSTTSTGGEGSSPATKGTTKAPTCNVAGYCGGSEPPCCPGYKCAANSVDGKLQKGSSGEVIMVCTK